MREAGVTEPVDMADPLEVQRWYRRIYAQCEAKLSSRADAEDAVQETFQRVVAQRQAQTQIRSMGAWLRRIAHNVCVDMIRRRVVRRASSDVELVPEPISESADTDEVRDHISALVHSLPDEQREVVLLHYYEDMTYEQMAEWLGVAKSTVNQRLSKARQSLRRKLAMAERP